MNSAYNLFEKILNDNRNAMVTYDFLANNVQPPYEYTDLLRWQWAQAVSALDKLVHDLVKIGISQEFTNTRQKTDKYLSLVIPIRIHTNLNLETDENRKLHIFQQYMVEKLSTESYQVPEKIADALAYIWSEQHKWQLIAAQMRLTEVDVKTKLKSIVLRRNQIVHAGDYIDISQPKQIIQKNDVMDVCDFIHKVGQAIFNLVK